MPSIVIPDDQPVVMGNSTAYKKWRTVTYYDTLPGSEDALLERIRGFEVVINIRSSTKFTERVFAENPSLRMLSIWGTGTDNVDLAAAKRHGVTVTNTPGVAAVSIARDLVELGFTVLATRGTGAVLAAHGVLVTLVNKVAEGRPHIVDMMKDGKVQLVFNTVDGASALTDSFTLRRTALMHKIAYYTTVAGAKASVEGIAAVSEGALDVAPLQSYFKGTF